MKLYRWMSENEFQLMSAGVTIKPRRNFRRFRTTGDGVFFLPSDCFSTERNSVPKHSDYFMSPQQTILFLSGIIERDSILVEFEAQDELEKAVGCYADPFDLDFYATVTVDELVTPSYDREKIRPIRYYVGDEWYKFN